MSLTDKFADALESVSSASGGIKKVTDKVIVSTNNISEKVKSSVKNGTNNKKAKMEADALADKKTEALRKLNNETKLDEPAADDVKRIDGITVSDIRNNFYSIDKENYEDKNIVENLEIGNKIKDWLYE